MTKYHTDNITKVKKGLTYMRI